MEENRMTNVLILTQPDDIHAIHVKLALESKGHSGVLCYSGDFPERQTHAINYTDGMMYWNSEGINDHLHHSHIDVVWNRRFGKPILPEYLHKDDIENAKKEVMSFYLALWQTVIQNAVWVNPIENQKKSNYKSYQLKIAHEVDLKIPSTIISNDPSKIKSFISGVKKQGAVYKTLMPLTWLSANETAMVYTRDICHDGLPSDHVLQSVPGIFQEKIEKAYELRVTYFGGQYIAVKIDSQSHSSALTDWRSAPTSELELTQVYLPVEIDKKCQLLMWRLGLLFGCFDFIVTPDDEYYFLEINEQGQFLWVEQVNHKILMLDAFTNFLISKGRGVSKERCRPYVALSDYDNQDIADIVASESRKHKGTSLLRVNQ